MVGRERVVLQQCANAVFGFPRSASRADVHHCRRSPITTRTTVLYPNVIRVFSGRNGLRGLMDVWDLRRRRFSYCSVTGRAGLNASAPELFGNVHCTLIPDACSCLVVMGTHAGKPIAALKLVDASRGSTLPARQTPRLLFFESSCVTNGTNRFVSTRD